MISVCLTTILSAQTKTAESLDGEELPEDVLSLLFYKPLILMYLLTHNVLEDGDLTTTLLTISVYKILKISNVDHAMVTLVALLYVLMNCVVLLHGVL